MLFRLFIFRHFSLLTEHAHFAYDPLKAENRPLYVKNKVDVK